jgi:DNA-binding transcriptional MerR regulator
MRALTTGELAELFNVSKYKIRHYVDEGILVPKRNKENGYYFFEESDIYRLYQIIIFRKIGFSIQEIKKSLRMDNTANMLEKAEINLQHKIDELLEIQKTIHKIVSSQKKYKLNEIIFVDREERYYKKVPKQIVEEDSIDYFKAVKLEISQLDEPYYIFSKQSTSVLCLKSKKEDSDYSFPTGIYACKNFVAKDRDTIENQVDSFLRDPLLNSRNYSLDNIIVYENIFCSLAYRDVMIYSIEVKL